MATARADAPAVATRGFSGTQGFARGSRARHGLRSTDADNATLPATEARTRDRVLQMVLERGPVSAADLAKRLGHTPTAVRRHLDGLLAEDLIEVKLVRSPGTRAGRPARQFVLSRAGQASLGDDYLGIARIALRELARIGGEEAVDRFIGDRVDDLGRRLAPAVEAAGEDIADRVRALGSALADQGFAGSSTTVDAGPMTVMQLCQGHCPVQELAAEFPRFCERETEMFAGLLGVDVRRLSTLAAGGHICNTHVPTGRAAVRVTHR
ncbi:helix-turn-helix domain-containing protein [Tersicoccus sp. MR15.9]|uniref:helix-turn-helix transcriptional regulator n=1 Tax=Tersicoccus mangrovi TaxID=3121635 RepID=UPI002FE6C1AB